MIRAIREGAIAFHPAAWEGLSNEEYRYCPQAVRNSNPLEMRSWRNILIINNFFGYPSKIF